MPLNIFYFNGLYSSDLREQNFVKKHILYHFYRRGLAQRCYERTTRIVRQLFLGKLPLRTSYEESTLN
jgi:hypothetical protein